MADSLGFDTLPPELAADAQALQRRKMLTDILLKNSMNPQQVPPGKGRFAVAQSPMAPLAQIAGGYAAAKSGEQNDADYRGLADRYNTGLGDAMKRYIGTKTGTPDAYGGSQGGPDADLSGMDSTFKPGAPGSPVNAAVGAMTSGYGPMKQIGMMDLQTMAKQGLTLEDILKLPDFDPQTRVTAARLKGSGYSDAQVIQYLQPKMDIKGHDGVFADFSRVGSGAAPREVGRVGTSDIPANWSDSLPAGYSSKPGDAPGVVRMKGADGMDDLYQMEFNGGAYKGLKKLDNAPKVTTNVNNTPTGAFDHAMGPAIVKDLQDSKLSAETARNDLGILKQAADAYNQGIKTGSFAEARNSLDRAAETLGFKSTDPKVANTDLFVRSMAQRILQHTKELRPMSDTDRTYLESILSGKNLDRAGMERFLNIAVESNLKGIDYHKSKVEKLSGDLQRQPGGVGYWDVSPPDTDGPGRFNIRIGPKPEDFGGRRVE